MNVHVYVQTYTVRVSPEGAEQIEGVGFPISLLSYSEFAQEHKETAVRVAEFGTKRFYADDGKLFCRFCNLILDHYWKDTVTKHMNSKVIN